ncbi:MAG: hypothetical protein ABI183_21940 [Polyangiaceae bacterium]
MAIFGLFLLVLAGCGSTEVHQIFLRQPSMIENREVEVYVAGAPPKRAYYDVAIVQTIGHGSDADVEHVTRALANRAGRLGCDAVVRVHVELGYGRAHGTGVCVVWAKTSPAAAAPRNPVPPPAAAPTTPEPTPPPTTTDETGGTSI